MSAQFVPGSFSQNERDADLALRNRRLGLLLWRVANGGVFLFFIFANYLMRSVQTSWPPEGVSRLDIGLPLLISAVLIASSFPATAALRAIRRSDAGGLIRNLWITIAGGLLFIAGLLVHMLSVPVSGPYSSIVLAMMGFHLVHAVVGIGLLFYVIMQARRDKYTQVNHWMAEAAVVFWHFVDLMWVFFFVVLYIL